MVATIEMPQVDTAPTQGDTATVLAAAKAKLAECKAVVDDWQAKYQQMEAETTSIEREAGERVLSGTLVADAGALIAAQRSAVAAIQRALDAAKRDREQAFIVMQRAKAADLWKLWPTASGRGLQRWWTKSKHKMASALSRGARDNWMMCMGCSSRRQMLRETPLDVKRS
jgi:hypothetical protein